MNNKEQLAMIDMSLKRHHINVYIKKCNFELDFWNGTKFNKIEQNLKNHDLEWI
jgi:hypothetical protein